MIDHEIAVELIRPGLGSVIKIYLKLIDDIDYDELVSALRSIVEVFDKEIGPYAIELTEKLSEAFLRLFSTKQGQGNEMELEEDGDTALTATGLFKALRRILQSISGLFPEIYPQLEVYLEQPIIAVLNDPFGTATDEGLTVIGELLYNQSQVSPRMW